uniref:Ig-like domain-containing protein n=1 Tax=Soboliphyme baturini TaxID=241478 RepID=A0A183IB37_9BILA
LGLPLILYKRDFIKFVFQNGRSAALPDSQYVNRNQQLRIAEVKEHHQGHYICVAENKAGCDEKHITVDFNVGYLVPPNMTRRYDRNFAVLECPIEAHEPPTLMIINWTKNGVAIKPTSKIQISDDSRKLSIIEAKLADSGRYTCLAVNSAGQDVFEVDVFVIGQKLTIWKKNDKELTESANRRISMNDGGVYSCLAENKLGRLEWTTVVRVVSAPKIVRKFSRIKVAVNSSVTILCGATGHPTPVLKWLKNGQKLNMASFHTNNGGQSIFKAKVTVEDSGYYTCMATNRLGSDHHSTALIILGKL